MNQTNYQNMLEKIKGWFGGSSAQSSSQGFSWQQEKSMMQIEINCLLQLSKDRFDRIQILEAEKSILEKLMSALSELKSQNILPPKPALTDDMKSAETQQGNYRSLEEQWHARTILNSVYRLESAINSLVALTGQLDGFRKEMETHLISSQPQQPKKPENGGLKKKK